MNVLLTSGTSQLASKLADGLSARHELRLTDRTAAFSAPNFAFCSLGHDLATDLVVGGIDAVVHVGEPLASESEVDYVDYMTRGTYNLCTAMSQRGVERLVLLNTLDVMAGYDEKYQVSEMWRPLPTDASYLLGKHLAEYVGKEFAREHKLTMVSLRIGITNTQELGNRKSTDNTLLDQDLVDAVELALTQDLPRWSVFHIVSSLTQTRYDVRAAQQMLGYKQSPTVQPA